MKKLILFLFFTSGISGLIYEIVWTRVFTLIFGNTTYAISTVLTAFMTGLAAGSFIFGRIVDKSKSPLMLYALIEISIGISALLVPLSFTVIENFYTSFLGDLDPASLFSTIIRFSISLLLLSIPATLMGGTLPVLSKYFILRLEELGWNIGIIYAVNTFGAVIGCFVTGYILIARIGVRNTTYLAVCMNVIIGFIAMTIAIKGKQMSAGGSQQLEDKRQWLKVKSKIKNPTTHYRGSPESKTPKPFNPSTPQLLMLIFFGISGFTSLAYEILWTRAFSLTFYSTVYLFSNILTVFLLGIAIGSLVFIKFLEGRRDVDLLRIFGIVEFLIGMCALSSILFFQWLPFNINSIGSLFGEMTWQKNIVIIFVINVCVMIFPTILMGLTFPLMGRFYTDNLMLLGRSIGSVYSVNTIGSIFGSFSAGFLIIPYFGIQNGILFLSFINLIIGIIIISMSPSRVNGLKWAGSASALILIVIIVKVAIADIDIGLGYDLNGNVLFRKEDISGTVKVVEDKNNYFRTLTVNNYSLATSGDVAVRFGHIPLLLHDNPEEVLVISLGSGITLGAVGQHPVKNIECVEIVPGVVEASMLFERENHNILKDPRVRLTMWDGRNYVLTTRRKYDVIISDLFQPDSAGTGNLYSKEHYQNCKDRLKKGGFMAQWLPLYQLSLEDLKVIMATFHDVFPHVTVWYGDINIIKPTLLLLGSDVSLKIDIENLQERMKLKGVISDLIERDNGKAFMSFFIMDEKGVARFVEGAGLNTDDKPYIEFSAPKYIWRRSESAVQNFRELSKFRELPTSILNTQHSALSTYFKGRGHIIQGRIYHFEGLFDREAEEYRLAENENPFDPYLGFAYFDLGYDYYMRGMYKDALAILERSRAINRDLKETQFYLAKSYYKLGMKSEYEEILRQNPEFLKPQ
ncbi:MAG: fused MFS/spermidine synthase [Nitrospinae bacterium]|nr:fused MFS/spermidine synthase [Nitrospinota bacterium]